MQYSVQFVGLACFLHGQGGRQVLLPDGRNPGNGIEPHFASIVVAGDAVESTTGWKDDKDAARGIFALPPCSIVFEGAEKAGALDTTRHDGRLPQLRRLAPDIRIDPQRAQTIASVDIRRGTLTAYRVPGGDAVITQLDVPHNGSISITVVPRDGSPQRSIRVRAGTEIALTNTARGGYAQVPEPNNHFRIYEKLSSVPVTLNEPDDVADVPPSPSHHVLFMRKTPSGLSINCSNTGCCDP